MARLTPAQLRNRLVFDHRVIRGLTATDHVTIKAFARADGRREREVSVEEGEAGLATRYVVRPPKQGFVSSPVSRARCLGDVAGISSRRRRAIAS